MRSSSLQLIGLLLCLGACSGESLTSPVPVANANAADSSTMSWWSRAALKTFLDANVALGKRSGFVVSIAHNGRVVHSMASGMADIKSQRPFELQTKVRIASMTKPITAVAAMQLVERGTLSLDQAVADFIPNAATARVALQSDQTDLQTQAIAQALTVRHLLTFSSGIGSETDGEGELGKLWNAQGIKGVGKGDLCQRIDALLTIPLFEQPGEKWRYGWSADVLACVVERASGMSFAQYLRANIFTPLGMNATFFAQEAEDLSDLATMYTQNEERNLSVIQAASHTTEWNSGGGGLISTANDYMKFALMMWNNGEYNGQRILKPETLQDMTRPHVNTGVLSDYDFEGFGWGLGLSVIADADATPMSDATGDFWWGGYYDTKFLVSPETGITVVVMAQNQPGEHSPMPIATHMVQSFAFMGI